MDVSSPPVLFCQPWHDWVILCLHPKRVFQARSQGVRGVRRTTPNLPKGPLFATKWAKMWFYEWGLGPKGPLFVTKWAKMGFYEGG